MLLVASTPQLSTPTTSSPVSVQQVLGEEAGEHADLDHVRPPRQRARIGPARLEHLRIEGCSVLHDHLTMLLELRPRPPDSNPASKVSTSMNCFCVDALPVELAWK